ncbi:hypothetical protein DPEC_G00013290 [Dallia pectoralis]|uniref:Uncharacterized protein n=1 Tax=Dallia pectoralis TaxID=75939 RepID=A0ACC2HMM4_DALPE|nr:hypothetical protein DPEC_G00013290 [Dallia pectoralis]
MQFPSTTQCLLSIPPPGGGHVNGSYLADAALAHQSTNSTPCWRMDVLLLLFYVFYYLFVPLSSDRRTTGDILKTTTLEPCICV